MVERVDRCDVRAKTDERICKGQQSDQIRQKERFGLTSLKSFEPQAL